MVNLSLYSSLHSVCVGVCVREIHLDVVDIGREESACPRSSGLEVSGCNFGCLPCGEGNTLLLKTREMDIW